MKDYWQRILSKDLKLAAGCHNTKYFFSLIKTDNEPDAVSISSLHSNNAE